MQDPFSMSCVESQRKTSLIHGKTEPPQKPKKFFSKRGQVALSRIWEEKNLDQEILFPGIKESNEVHAKEKVSDYVQHYLIQRAKRISLSQTLRSFGRWSFSAQKSGPGPQLQTISISGNPILKELIAKRKGESLLREYEESIEKGIRLKDQMRINKEIERIERELMSGEIKAVPQGFEGILNDPIFRIRRLMDSIRSLESKPVKLRTLPFEMETKPIKVVSVPYTVPHEKVSERHDKILDRERLKLPVEDIRIASSFSTTSSGVEIVTLDSSMPASKMQSPLISSKTKERPLTSATFISSSGSHNRDYKVECPPSSASEFYENQPGFETTENPDATWDFDLEEMEVSIAMLFEGRDGYSGELEISYETEKLFQDSGPLVTAVTKQSELDVMYKMAAELLHMLERQEVAGDEFVESLVIS